jgi:hypothetical protein
VASSPVVTRSRGALNVVAALAAIPATGSKDNRQMGPSRIKAGGLVRGTSLERAARVDANVFQRRPRLAPGLDLTSFPVDDQEVLLTKPLVAEDVLVARVHGAGTGSKTNYVEPVFHR